MELSYAGYRETLSKLSRMYRNAYRQDGHKAAQPWREMKRQVRADYPEYGDRYTREALGFPPKRPTLSDHWQRLRAEYPAIERAIQ